MNALPNVDDATARRTPAPSFLEGAWANPLTVRSGLGALGAAVAIAGVFLPQVDVNSPFPIVHNSILGNDSVTGILVMLVALAGAFVSFRTRNLAASQSKLVVKGIFLIAGAIYLGTGGRVDLEGTGMLAGQSFHGSPAIGVWAVCLGGVLIALAGLIPGPFSGRE